MSNSRDQAFAHTLRCGAVIMRQQEQESMDFVFNEERDSAEKAVIAITQAHELVHDYIEALKGIPGQEDQAGAFSLIHVAVSDMHIRLIEHLANLLDPPNFNKL